MRHSIFLLALATVFFNACATNYNKDTTEFVPNVIKNSNEVSLDHKFFVITYDLDHNIAKWVRYTLKKADLNGPGKRPSRFKPDPLLLKINAKAIKHADYTNSGYVRGHLAPAEDFSRSQEAIESTFVMSNVIPQLGNVNSGAWAQLEKKIRLWACGEESITVFTGPIIELNLPTLPSGVLIPEKFFKVVIDDTPPQKIVAFIYNQHDSGQKLNEKIVDPETILAIKDVITIHKYSPTSSETIEDWKQCQM